MQPSNFISGMAADSASAAHLIAVWQMLETILICKGQDLPL